MSRVTKLQLGLEDITEYDFEGFEHTCVEEYESVKITLSNFARMTLPLSLLEKIKGYLGWEDYRVREERIVPNDARFTYYYEYYFTRIN